MVAKVKLTITMFHTHITRVEGVLSDFFFTPKTFKTGKSWDDCRALLWIVLQRYFFLTYFNDSASGSVFVPWIRAFYLTDEAGLGLLPSSCFVTYLATQMSLS